MKACPSNYGSKMFLIKKYVKFLFISLVILLLSPRCENSYDPVDDNSNEYMSLNIGDIRQYSMPYSANPEIHTVWKITGKTYRSDSTEVYVGEWYTYNLNPQNKYESYYFIRDGFLYSTELKETSKYPGNPFFEQKLAKIKPKDGDMWLQIVGYVNPDSTQDYLTARHIDELDTPAGKFQDVFIYISSKGSVDTEQSRIYYAKYWGHLGIAFTNKKSDLFIVNYMKVKGREIGKYVSMNQSVTSNHKPAYYNKKLELNSILGAKQNYWRYSQ